MNEEIKEWKTQSVKHKVQFEAHYNGVLTTNKATRK